MKHLLTTAGAAAFLGVVLLAGAPAMAGPSPADTAKADPAKAATAGADTVKMAHATDQSCGHESGSSAMGRGMMGQGMHGQGMYGRGMKSQGMHGQGQGMHGQGQGMHGQGMHAMMMAYQGHVGMGSGLAEKDLTADAVKKIIEGRLAWNGRDRLKVSTVTKKDDDTYVAEIVTLEDSLVERLEVNRKTGFTRRIR